MLRRTRTSHLGAATGRLRSPSSSVWPTRVQPLGWGSWLRWTLAILVVLGALIYLLWSVFSMLLAATAFAYLLDPVVDWFEERHFSRALGIVVIFLATLLGLTVLGLVVVPSITHQIAELSGNIGIYVNDLAAFLQPYKTWVEAETGLVLPFNLVDLGHEIPNYLERLSPDAQSALKAFIGKALSSGVGLVMTIINLALLPIFVFYILQDWDRMVAQIKDLVPARYKAIIFKLAGEIDGRISSFVRGQITVCLLLGVLYSGGLWAFSGIDLPIVVGSLSGVLFIVPYLGTIVGVVLASTLAMLKFGMDYHLLVVWAVFGVVQALEGMVLTPYIVGDKVGLHPLVVMIALIVGGNLLGIWGMLLAIPITAAISVLMKALLAQYRDSAYFRLD